MEQMTVLDALISTANILGNICVPRNLNQMIGVPIDTAIMNIQACINAINEKREQDGTDHAE